MIGNKAIAPGLLLIASINFLPTVTAEMTMQGGRGGSCFPLVHEITRNWIDVKQVMLPPSAKLQRPKREDFFCVSPYYLRNAIERRVAASTQLRCYSNPANSGLGMCCDQELRSCAQLRPELVPETARRTQKKARPTGSNSSWVTPPSEEDQWKTTPD